MILKSKILQLINKSANHLSMRNICIYINTNMHTEIYIEQLHN